MLAALASSSCAPALLKLPSGPGEPARDGPAVLQEATRRCEAVSSLTAEIGVSGSLGGHRLRARLLAGVAAPASVRLEAVAPFGPPIFFFAAHDDDATVLLARERRVLEHGRPSAVLEALTGLPLNGADLRRVLTGCADAPRADEAARLGDDWRSVPDRSGMVFLHREPPGGQWRVAAALMKGTAGWRSEYRDFQLGGPADGLPRAVRLTSADRERFDIRLTLSQIEVNVRLDAAVFTVEVPSDTEPMTLEELERSGPLAYAAAP